MRDFYLIGFLLALPALAAVGHDIYFAYEKAELELANRFMFIDLGRLWVLYAPDSYDWTLANTDEAIWNNLIDPVLQESAFFVASVPFLIFVLVVCVQKLLGLGPFEGHSILTTVKAAGLKKKTKGGFAFGHGNDHKKKKYKRK